MILYQVITIIFRSKRRSKWNIFLYKNMKKSLKIEIITNYAGGSGVVYPLKVLHVYTTVYYGSHQP